MFSQDTIAEIENVAQEEGVDAAALLAIAEVESGGRAFALVGGRREPLIRFEGHYFDRLIGKAKRNAARRAGLAAAKWGVVKNPRGQAARWKMLDHASKLDRSAALQSVSWGIGQVMGSHWKELGYASPEALVKEARSSVGGQVRLMMRFIRKNGLLASLNKRDWEGFARRYNGPAYKKNQYDTRMAAAYARHANRTLKRSVTPRLRQSKYLQMGTAYGRERVQELQAMLINAGFEVVADGVFGPKTDAALRAFQKQRGLHVDGVLGPKTRGALAALTPKTGWLGTLVFVLRNVTLLTGIWRKK